MGDKGAVGASLYIEDAPANVEKLRRDGHAAIVFTNSTNRHLAGPRADTWDQVYEMVMHELERWQARG
jgi:beta-phosphoglucomutase-like phosphatase (HAD superfamily)